RPMDGVLVIAPVGRVQQLPGAGVNDENVEPSIVIEVSQTFAGRRLVKIPRDHYGIAAGFRRFGARRRGNEGNLLAVRRPSDTFSLAGQRRVGALHGSKERSGGAIGVGDNQSGVVAVSPLEGQ